MWQKRNYDDPRYKEFRRQVRKRDGYMCRWPGCSSRKSLQVHHIKKWSSSILTRYSVFWGITLCKKHHKFVTGKEEIYAPLLLTRRGHG